MFCLSTVFSLDAKTIGSNSLVGFPCQIASSAVGAGVLGALPIKPEGLGLILGLINGLACEVNRVTNEPPLSNTDELNGPPSCCLLRPWWK
jgi:hypothetical protein